MVYHSALQDHLFYGFNIDFAHHSLDLLKRGFVLQHQSTRTDRPLWSLQKVLDDMAAPRYLVNTSMVDALQKAVFLVAMATGA